MMRFLVSVVLLWALTISPVESGAVVAERAKGGRSPRGRRGLVRGTASRNPTAAFLGESIESDDHKISPRKGNGNSKGGDQDEEDEEADGDDPPDFIEDPPISGETWSPSTAPTAKPIITNQPSSVNTFTPSSAPTSLEQNDPPMFTARIVPLYPFSLAFRGGVINSEQSIVQVEDALSSYLFGAIHKVYRNLLMLDIVFQEDVSQRRSLVVQTSRLSFYGEASFSNSSPDEIVPSESEVHYAQQVALENLKALQDHFDEIAPGMMIVDPEETDQEEAVVSEDGENNDRNNEDEQPDSTLTRSKSQQEKDEEDTNSTVIIVSVIFGVAFVALCIFAVETLRKRHSACGRCRSKGTVEDADTNSDCHVSTDSDGDNDMVNPSQDQGLKSSKSSDREITSDIQPLPVSIKSMDWSSVFRLSETTNEQQLTYKSATIGAHKYEAKSPPKMEQTEVVTLGKSPKKNIAVHSEMEIDEAGSVTPRYAEDTSENVDKFDEDALGSLSIHDNGPPVIDLQDGASKWLNNSLSVPDHEYSSDDEPQFDLNEPRRRQLESMLGGVGEDSSISETDSVTYV